MQKTNKQLKNLKVGDVVTRYISSKRLPNKLKVTKITDSLIFCGPWKFDKETGAEIDEDLGWDKYNTGSVIEIE